jgi:pyruvate formate lyase activating enzyme
MRSIKGETTTLAELLDARTHESELHEKFEDKKVRCCACAHRCVIFEGKRGICQVRFNRDGKLYVPWGYVGSLGLDPIEKKPFYHVLPGARTLTLGMLGCDLHCPYCQNWMLSQTLRDRNAGALPHDVTPQELVSLARRYGAQAVISSYNEPLITSEWAVAVFKEAKRAEMLTGYVSNGNATREVLQYLRPYLDCYKIDLKTFQDKNYRMLGAVLQNILDGIALVHEMGFWSEIVTLVVPGLNDSDEELRQIAKFLVSLSPDIPWHVTAFHKNYKMTDPDNTPAGTLIRAAQIGYDAGLHFVYTGNLPGMTERYENTYCPGCGALLIERYGFAIVQNRLRGGHCPECRRVIPGVWKI